MKLSKFIGKNVRVTYRNEMTHEGRIWTSRKPAEISENYPYLFEVSEGRMCDYTLSGQIHSNTLQHPFDIMKVEILNGQ